MSSSISHRPRAGAAAAAVSAATVAALVAASGISLGTSPAAAAQFAPTPAALETVAAVAVDDAFVTSVAPTRLTGAFDELASTYTSSAHKTTYLKFRVPELPDRATFVSARVVLTRTSGTTDAVVRLNPVDSSDWSESTLTWQNRPAYGPSGTLGALLDGTKSVHFATSSVTPGAAVSFAVTTDNGVQQFAAKESALAPPTLVVSYSLPSARAEAPTPATPAPRPSKPPVKRAPTPTPPSPTSPSPTAPSSGTLFGSNIYRDGLSFNAALDRQEGKYGDLEVVRIFYTGAPAAWPGPAGSPGKPVVVSFKFIPRDITAGKYDAYMADWFNDAPRDRPVYWTLWHEPEDDIGRGAFTAADYRAAVRHLDGLADRARNSRLKNTMILMCYSLRESSGRNWRDYFAGADVVDVLGWDCYNTSWDGRELYMEPAKMFSAARDAARSVGKPFGIAEFGSPLITGDSGPGRAAWLRSSATWLRANGAAWVTYFDAPIGFEYRLFDKPSIDAWRWAVSGS